MDQGTLPHLTEEELLKEQQKLISSKRIDAVLIGLFVGVAIYSAAQNGLGFATFLPLFFVFLFLRKRKKLTVIEEELEARQGN